MKAEDFEVQVKLVLVPKNAKPFTPALGKGVVALCERVRDMGSLNKAAHDMGMSYSKAWRIMKSAEEEFGISLLDRNGPKGSDLTEQAHTLIEVYEHAASAAQAAAEAVIAEELAQ
ncbi:MAG: LysR family transcriptional regulator [Coriobacteriia bacterium]|nr:LysR family transcriptional regulator [Coriobacteriia bacterium]